MVATCAATSPPLRRADHHAHGPWRGGRPDRRARAGADDYVVKPFSAGELVARMRAIMRRGRGGDDRGRKAPITIGAISLDPAARIVTKGSASVDLATKEFDLLRLLMSRAGEVVPPRRSWTRCGIRTGSGPRRRSTCTSHGCGKLEDDPLEPSLHHHHTRRRVPLRLTEGRLKERSPRRSERVSSWPSPTCSSR